MRRKEVWKIVSEIRRRRFFLEKKLLLPSLGKRKGGGVPKK